MQIGIFECDRLNMAIWIMSFGRQKINIVWLGYGRLFYNIL